MEELLKFLNNGCYLDKNGKLRISKSKQKEILENTKDCISYSNYIAESTKDCVWIMD
jgi:hypothetical protein